MTVLIIGLAVLFFLFVAICSGICFSSFKKEEKIIAFLKKTQKLYDTDKKEEAKDLLRDAIGILIPEKSKYCIEARRQYGWIHYHLAIKIKDSECKKRATLMVAESSFEAAMPKVFTSDDKQAMSVFNGYPLVLWLLDKKSEAKTISNIAVNGFSMEPSVWNTKAILAKWEGNLEESVDVCERVAVTAEAKKEYITAGHGKQNQGDAFMALRLPTEAKNAYQMALSFYLKSEKSGKKATMHIESVKKKITGL